MKENNRFENDKYSVSKSLFDNNDHRCPGLFPGRSIRAAGLPFTGPPALAGDEGESEIGKAHLKSNMRWND
jgi:hypothetical protein